MVARIQVKIEDTTSRTGKHRRIAKVYIIDEHGNIIEPKLLNPRSCKGVYSDGESKCGYIDIEDGELAAVIELTRNWRNNIKGYITLFNSSSTIALKVKFVNNKLRYVSGDKKLIDIVKKVVEKLEVELQWKHKK